MLSEEEAQFFLVPRRSPGRLLKRPSARYRAGRPEAIQRAKYRPYSAAACQSTSTSLVDQLSLSVYRLSKGVVASRGKAGSPQ